MALQEDRIRNGIAVVGGGTSGYLSTYFLCKNYPDVQIRWIYPEQNYPIGVGEATVPAVTDFLSKLGITPEVIISELNGSLKLGIMFRDFYKEGKDFYHPFGCTDDEAAKLKLCMKLNAVPEDILQWKDIATHFDVTELMRYLDSKFSQFKNLTIERKTVKAPNLLLEDTVLDCTGFDSGFCSDPWNFIPCTDKIPNNAALVYRGKYKIESQKMNFTVAKAMNHGWIWGIPLGGKLSVGYVHDNAYDVRNEFLDILKGLFTEVDESEIRTIHMRTGRRKSHITDVDNKKVIHIGLNSMFIEPLESTGLYLTVQGIEMMDLYLNGKVPEDVFSILLNREYDVILDFIIAHYKYSTRDNKYWNRYKDLEIEEYRENNIFPERSWKFILDGMGKIEYNPELSAEDMIRFLKTI